MWKKSETPINRKNSENEILGEKRNLSRDTYKGYLCTQFERFVLIYEAIDAK